MQMEIPRVDFAKP